jgi:hypothetical protein
MTVAVTYVLEWTATGKIEGEFAADGSLTFRTSNVWMLDPTAPAYVTFWDPSGKPLGETVHRIDIPKPFRDYAVLRHEVTLSLATISNGAVTVSVALGASRLETSRSALP